ncbi:adhesion G-protein coupled receptor F3-like [Heptranchias perlo]|uniref:adhesion G-protein coupled receptor F3-like n=1 Tax=Heptranchias perlo TaxID=212740 RepID=UPI003559652C
MAAVQEEVQSFDTSGQDTQEHVTAPSEEEEDTEATPSLDLTLASTSSETDTETPSISAQETGRRERIPQVPARRTRSLTSSAAEESDEDFNGPGYRRWMKDSWHVGLSHDEGVVTAPRVAGIDLHDSMRVVAHQLQVEGVEALSVDEDGRVDIRSTQGDMRAVNGTLHHGEASNTMNKTVEMMFLVTVVYCLLLPLSSSKFEANLYCSAQNSSLDGNKSTINDNQGVKRFYHADLNLERTQFKTVAAYVQRIVFPVVVNIPGTSGTLTIFNFNIINECKYLGNGAMCIFWNETTQSNSECSVESSSQRSTLPPCICSQMYIDEIGFYPEHVTSLTMKGIITGSFKINEDFNEKLLDKNQEKKLTAMVCITQQNIIATVLKIKATTALNFSASGPFRGATSDISRVCQSSAHKCKTQVTDRLFARVHEYVNFPHDNISQNEQLANSYSNLTGFQCVRILQFRKGSIVVDYELTVSGELSSKLLKSHIKDANNLINQTYNLDLNFSQVTTEGFVEMQISPGKIYYKKPVTIKCTIKDNVEEALWFIKAPKDDEEALISERHYNFISSDHLSESKLKINATSIWKGNYCCYFGFENQSILHKACGDPNIYLLPEEITTIPSQYTLSKSISNLPAEVKCCIKNDGENYNITLEANSSSDGVKLISNKILSADNDLWCWTYEISRKFVHSANYSCTFTNSVYQRKSKNISIVVLSENDKSCKPEESEGYDWITTRAGLDAETNVSCGTDRVGKIIRHCDKDGQWGKVFINCTQKVLVELLNLAQELVEGRGAVSQKLPAVLRNLSVFNQAYESDSNTADTDASINILETLSNAAINSKSSFNTSIVSDFLSIASNVTQSNSEKGRTDYSHSSTLMKSVEQFSQALLPPGKEFSVAFPTIKLKGKEFDPNSTIDYFQNFSGPYTVTAEIDSESLKAMMKNNYTFKISSILYSKIGDILPQKNIESKEFQENYFLNSLVQSTSLKVANDKNVEKNQNINITMVFSSKSQSAILETATCVFWNFELFEGEGGWSTAGCTTTVNENGTICICEHLTSFGVLMSRKPRHVPYLEEITKIGLGISIVSLILCITVEIIVWNTVVKSSIAHFRHTTLINTAIALLFAQSSFLIGSIHSVKTNETLCIIATIFTHFFFLSVFFWTLTQSLTLLHQLIFVFHHLRKSVFMSFALIVGYACPLAIVIGATTSFVNKGNYTRKNNCWLNAMPLGEFTAFHTFVVPLGCIIGINMLILTVVIVKLMRPSVSEGKKKEDKETIKKIIKAVLILTPVFGLTWIIGFATMDERSPDFVHYAFVSLNSIQGLFILITATFTESKVRKAFIKQVKSTTWQTMSENTYSKASTHAFTK